MANLVFKNIDKIYDNKVQAVFDFNLEIKDGEFIVFVGPSGCGKSTTLRMVAGLEEISRGELYIDGKLVNNVLPKDRDIAMVFQSYALYPHMSVYDNMAFGLKLRKFSKSEIDERVKEAARILEIENYLNRKPKALSGGQRQRVALGRAIVRNAKVFLMDEPLSNLDAKLRVSMRSEIIKLHKRLKATTIYVTHDQTEAMTMADRIVIMKDGHIMQVGSPKDIYNNPANIFVASFIGSPAMNFINAYIDGNYFVIKDRYFIIPSVYKDALKAYDKKKVIIGIRPEDLHREMIIKDTYPESNINFKVNICELLGHEFILHGEALDHSLVAKISAREDISSGDIITLAIDMAKIKFFDPETEKAIN